MNLNFASFALDVIGPVIVLIDFGYSLFKFKKINDDFVDTASRLVFNFALPALLFSTISTSDINALANAKVISIGVVGTLVVFLFMLVLCTYTVSKFEDRGVVVQGAFRSNMGIIGLAYCENAYGTEGLAYGSVYMGVLTILYNLLSVGVLNVYNSKDNDKKVSYTQVIKDIGTNPIIIGIVLGICVSMLKLDLPIILTNSANYFAQLTLPLALICTGAALRFSTMKKNGIASILSIGVKCIAYPFIIVLSAVWLGVNGMPLMVLFLMAISPTAAASYVMVRKIGGNHELAAQIIAISTVLSVPFTLLGFAFIGAYV